jgi:trimethylamine:corrinoid methyltransferase-like protein
MTWGMEGDPSRQSLLTITFKKLRQSTELTLRQEGLGSASNRDDHRKGWNSALNKLVAYLTTLPTQGHTI